MLTAAATVAAATPPDPRLTGSTFQALSVALEVGLINSLSRSLSLALTGLSQSGDFRWAACGQRSALVVYMRSMLVTLLPTLVEAGRAARARTAVIASRFVVIVTGPHRRR
jgi:hypothetical protein